jgi:hypothetical protein
MKFPASDQEHSGLQSFKISNLTYGNKAKPLLSPAFIGGQFSAE